MAINLKLPELPGRKSKKAKPVRKGKIPTKKHINLLVKKQQTFNLRKHLPILILLALIVIAGGKYLVVDRLVGIAIEANRVSNLQEELADANRQINELSELEDTYAHYTISGMTDEELNRVDRVAAMKMVDEAFQGGNISRSWNLTGNVMTLQVSGPSLSELNLLAAELEVNPIVERCVISSANKYTDVSGNVAVTFIIYLQKQTAE